MDVLTAVLTVADHYGLVDEVSRRVELSISRAAADGLLTEEEMVRAR